MFQAARQSKLQQDGNDDVFFVDNGNTSYRLSLYDQPPLYDVTVEEFETSALDRLRILAEIESSAARNRSWDETKQVTITQCGKYLPLNSNSASGIDIQAERRKDQLGHFVLRLAFCRSEELRRRFTKAETTLFKIRFESDDSNERRAFLNSKDFNWISVSKNEKDEYKGQLQHFISAKVDLDTAFNNEAFYKVKWTTIPDLVEKRKVFLKNGYAYVPAREQASIIYAAFEERLEAALLATSRAIPLVDEDMRLNPILDNLAQGFTAGVPSDWVASAETTGEGITADMVDSLAKQHFPLCMRVLHQNLRKDHHLKHFGRLHYGLFLKVLGLSIDEAIAFWRKSFAGGSGSDKFDKEYRYNIRHSFGLEGRRMNYPAKNCLQLHSAHEAGCPYRQLESSPENLQSALLSSYSAQGLTVNDLPEIMAQVKKRSYHVACTRVFEITHARSVRKGEGLRDGESVTHPNQYAARSIELEKESKEMEVDFV
ncbi:eukaryotic and archaeal DNA primase, large subunit-domain-containing protein [Lentinula aff. detonsa]|uniref:DNA primase large subunit n=1 Tax=Lentinula aff. detonsa TaxID=2804958 RepID=A0AA38KFM1_9AGAR|nr:eukaryotic and archaeal DNA primase, large subunit-domain-containing protein [Lentinula aff. detonsa]KAJ3798709.1 eukaryotic and archaeal DNA primase, large subunit-domain-containing protein [Lentinula aff. detonsa]